MRQVKWTGRAHLPLLLRLLPPEAEAVVAPYVRRTLAARHPAASVLDPLPALGRVRASTRARSKCGWGRAVRVSQLRVGWPGAVGVPRPCARPYVRVRAGLPAATALPLLQEARRVLDGAVLGVR